MDALSERLVGYLDDPEQQIHFIITSRKGWIISKALLDNVLIITKYCFFVKGGFDVQQRNFCTAVA